MTVLGFGELGTVAHESRPTGEGLLNFPKSCRDRLLPVAETLVKAT